jgi:hypothetical protein
MAKYRCKCCPKQFGESEIVVRDDGQKCCPACGSPDIETNCPSRIKLSFGGFSISFHRDCKVGRDDFRLCEEYKWVSPAQFRLLKKDDGWFIAGEENVKNDTFLNDASIKGKESQVAENSQIFIGNKEKKIGLLITVSFER